MGSLRVTQGILVQRTMNNISKHMRKLMTLQDQMSTGYKINSPSDDPIDARRSIDARTSVGKYTQYMDNISSVGPQLSETATSIMTTIDIVQRTHELTLQGANTTNAQLQLDIIAKEIDQLLESVFVEANHQTNNRYIFAGTRTNDPAYTETRNVNGEITAITYNGNSDDIKMAMSDGVEVIVNESGDAIFQSTEDIFQVIIDIRDDMYAGNYTNLENDRLYELENVREQLLRGIAKVGAVQNRLDRAKDNLDGFTVQLESVQSDAIDADYADTVIRLNAASNAFQAGLSAAARVIQPSLLDFVG